MPATNEEFIKKAFEAGLSEDQVRQAVAERNKKLQQSQTSSGNPLVGVAQGISKFLFPRTTQVAEQIPQELEKAKVALQERNFKPGGVAATELVGGAAGPIAAYLLNEVGRQTGFEQLRMPERQLKGYGLAGEVSQFIPTLMTGGLAPSGAMRGAVDQLTTPEDISLLERAARTAGGGAIGYGLGKAFEGVSKLFQKNKLGRAGTELIASQYNAPRSAASANRTVDTLNKLAEYGITDPSDVQIAAEKVTGPNGVFSKVTREAAANANPIDTTGLRSVAAQIASDPSIPVGQDNKMRTFFQKLITDDPLQIVDNIRAVEAKAASMTKGRLPNMITSSDEAMEKAYKLFADELKDRLGQAGVNKTAVIAMQNPEYIKKLAEVSPKLAEQAAQATSWQEIRSLAAPFVRGENLANITEQGLAYGFQNMAGGPKGLGKFFNLLNLPAMVMSSGVVNRNVGQALRGAGGALQKAPIETVSPYLISLLNSISGGL